MLKLEALSESFQQGPCSKVIASNLPLYKFKLVVAPPQSQPAPPPFEVDQTTTTTVRLAFRRGSDVTYDGYAAELLRDGQPPIRVVAKLCAPWVASNIDEWRRTPLWKREDEEMQGNARAVETTLIMPEASLYSTRLANLGTVCPSFTICGAGRAPMNEKEFSSDKVYEFNHFVMILEDGFASLNSLSGHIDDTGYFLGVVPLSLSSPPSPRILEMYRRLQAAGVAHNDVGARHILTRQEKIIDQTDAENEEFVNSLTLCIIDFDGAMSA